MPIFHPKWLRQIKATGVNKKPRSKKSVSTATYQTHIKQILGVNGVIQTHEKNCKHFYIPQNDIITPPLKIRDPLNECRGSRNHNSHP